MSITRADIVINGSTKGGLMMICMKCATSFQSRGYKVEAVDIAADAHIEAHSDSRLVLGSGAGQ